MADIKALAEELVNLTVKDVQELAKLLKEEYGIEPAAAAVAVAAAPAEVAAPAEQTETVMKLELDRMIPGKLSEGFRFAELDPAKEAYAFQWLLWQGFDHGDDRAEFEREDPIIPQIRRHFDPALSIAAVDQAGEKLAYCCLWYQQGTDYAYVEPVCTVPAARGKGLARAVLLEALNRAKKLGAE